MKLFVDTSIWYAAAFAGDRYHARARQIFATDDDLVTGDHVLVETWLLINSPFGHARAHASGASYPEAAFTLNSHREPTPRRLGSTRRPSPIRRFRSSI